MKQKIDDELTYKIIGCAMKVHNTLEDEVMVELKALVQLEDVHLAQGLNYLAAYNLDKGLLINFGGRSLEVKRLFRKNKQYSNPDNPVIQ